MINVVNSIFISSQCPKYLQPLCAEVRKTLHYEFEDGERMERFVNGCRSFVGRVSAQKNAKLAFYHNKSEDGGTITVGKCSEGYSDFIRISYFKLRGRLEVSFTEPTKVYPQNFIEEGGEV